MNREKMIDRLVARKMHSKGKRPFCICIAGTNKTLCFAAA